MSVIPNLTTILSGNVKVTSLNILGLITSGLTHTHHDFLRTRIILHKRMDGNSYLTFTAQLIYYSQTTIH